MPCRIATESPSHLALPEENENAHSRFGRARIAVLIACAFVASGVAAEPALAFDSYTPWGGTSAQHNQITRAAATAKGWSDEAITNLEYYVRDVDWTETSTKRDSPDTPRYLGPNDNYHHTHHFDRTKGSDGNFRNPYDVLADSSVYFRSQIDQAVNDAMAFSPPGAFQALGKALHAIEDVCSHSNPIDLPAADRNKIVDFIFGIGSTPLPAGLLLTSYVTNRVTENPTDDPLNYTHGRFSKDNPKKNAEAQVIPMGQPLTKFALAYNLANTLAQRVLQTFRDGLDDIRFNAVSQYGTRAALSPKYTLAATGHYSPGSDLTVSADGTTLTLGPGSLPAEADVAILGAPLDVFRETDEIIAPGGQMMGLLREIDLDELSVGSPGHAAVLFPLSEVSDLIPSTLQVFFFDPFDFIWTPLPNASITFDFSGNATADFAVASRGLYAIGGVPIPEPAGLTLISVACLTLTPRRR